MAQTLSWPSVRVGPTGFPPCRQNLRDVRRVAKAGHPRGGDQVHAVEGIRRAACIESTMPALAAFLVALPSATEGPLHFPADYPTIQAALDAAQPGDVVLVAPGLYSEQLVVRTTVTLAPEFITTGDRTSIESTVIESDDAIEVQSTAGPETTIAGLTIGGSAGEGIHAFATTRTLDNHIVGFNDGNDFAPAEPTERR